MQNTPRPDLSLEEFKAEMIRCPIFFGEEVLGERFTPQQKDALAMIRDHDRCAFPAGHSVGKTRMMSTAAIWWVTTRKPAKCITTAPTGRQVHKILWSEIRARRLGSLVDLGGNIMPRQSFWEFGEEGDHYAFGFSTDELDSMSGFHSPNLMIIGDEAEGIEEPIHIAIRGLASGAGNKIVYIGNPGPEPSGEFYTACQNWNSIRLDCHDHPNVIEGREVFPGMVTKGFVEECARDWGEESPLYEARVRGMFPDSGDKTMIPLRFVERGYHAEPEDWVQAQPVVAVDVARYGTNETVIAVLRGGRIREIRRFVGQDTMRTVGITIDTFRELNEPNGIIVIDDDGVGGGVTDRLVEQRYPVRAFRGGEKPRDQRRFINKRAEAWWWVREALRDGHMGVPENPKLRTQLTAPHYTFDSAGRVKLETKEQMEKRGVVSPDIADAVVMAWWGRGQPAESIAVQAAREVRDDFEDEPTETESMFGSVSPGGM